MDFTLRGTPGTAEFPVDGYLADNRVIPVIADGEDPHLPPFRLHLRGRRARRAGLPS